jgi:exonuclease SbcC
MNWRDLDSLTVSNFRSIRGPVTIPLSAPITLIHGSNGAGKTSVLSALELGLTGAVRGLENVRPGDLIHRGCSRATVRLGSPTDEHIINVVGGQLQGAALLSEARATFFAERCYLGQAILAKLLQSYQEVSGSDDSPLTRFVRQLLRIDELDALVDGLWFLGHRARVRNAVPSFRPVEKRIEELRAESADLASQDKTVSGEQARGQRRLRELLASIDEAPRWDETLGDDDVLALWLRSQDVEPMLDSLNRYRRDLRGVAQRLGQLEATRDAPGPAESEAAAAAARVEVQKWQADAGDAIERAVVETQAFFPDIPSSVAQDPHYSLQSALQRLKDETGRLQRGIAAQESRERNLETAARELEQANARLGVVDEALASATPSSRVEALARDLAALSAHIDTDNCPVCGRDFTEVSSEPLANHVSNELARLSEEAFRIQELTRARLAALEDVARATSSRDGLREGGLPPAELVAMGTRLARIDQLHRRLSSLDEESAQGSRLLEALRQAERELASAHERDEAGRQIRLTLAEIAEAVSLPAPEGTESAEAALRRLDSELASRAHALEQHGTICAEVGGVREALIRVRTQLAEVRRKALETGSALVDTKSAMDELDSRRAAGRALRQAVLSSRGNVIRSVFSDALNESWRDLFVRLAPAEPFVPAFKLPEPSSESLTVELHTVHRDGGNAGTPEVMLSTGNLNTAALTLFLALHLSVPDRLPWLVLDDPVQSMDEIHISQLAALLRTLARQHGIKILVAVHDRALFDYLRLELSPAVEGDELVTAELRRIPEGDSGATVRHHAFEPDLAIAVA